MLRDVFYYGQKPNAHPRERFAKDLDDAIQQSTTEHFWIINEHCDYRGFDWDFDFEFLPDEDVWAENHINIWPSQHQKDSGTWLVNADNSTPLFVYRNDVDIVYRKQDKTNWVFLDKVDELKFDFSWHPDPTDPPYIYKWGCKYFPAELKHVLEYRVPNATQEKYMKDIVELLPNYDCIVEIQKIDRDKFDLSWRPDPMDPPFIYVWGNKYIDGKLKSTLEYHVPGATEKKHMPDLLTVLPEPEKFEILEEVDKTKFDFSWRPDPTSPPYIYAWGNQWNKPEDKISIQYIVEGATEYKYMEERATRRPCMNNWVIPENIDISGFDFSWEPSPADPAYIYEFGTQHQKTGGPQYIVAGATEKKYIDFQKVKNLPSKDNWVLPTNVDVASFDFSWHPDSTDPLYIYQFGTQWALSGGPKYVMPGATEVKYMDNMVAKALPNMDNWEIPEFVDKDDFDYSWHPYAEDEPYIYQFGTQWQKTGGHRYITPGSHKNSPTKYIDTRILKSKRIPNKSKFAILNNYKIKDFDYSWHPDETEEPYIYVFGNDFYPGEIMPTIEYIAKKDATKIKYVHDIQATLEVDKTNWVIPDNIDSSTINFAWMPNPKDPPLIYQFGTQHQKTGGPKYIVEGATEVKYINEPKAIALPQREKFSILNNSVIAEFDYSWHPDDTEEPYIYVFGNNQYPAEIMPTIEYAVPGAKQIKYVNDIVATLGIDRNNWVITQSIDETKFDFTWKPNPKDPPYIYRWGNKFISGKYKATVEYVVPEATDIKYMTDDVEVLPELERWVIPDDVDTSGFDFSWRPDPREPALIYQFGTQWQKTGGPKYVMPEATEIKYNDTQSVIRISDKSLFATLDNLVIDSFDYSWHPDDTEEPYIYVFGNNQYPAEIMPTIEYVVPGATQIKYINAVSAKLGIDKTNWEIPNNIDTTGFDFSWKPNPKDPLYIYEFGTQHQKTGGPRYVVPGATETKYIDTMKVKALVSMTNWVIPSHIDITNFDFSWHPDNTDPLYIYQFGTQWALSGGPKYVMSGATEIKYMDNITARALPNKNNWEIPEYVDTEAFDYSWHPYEEDEPYIYQFGTQHQKTGGHRYITPGSHKNSPVKYIDTRILKSKRLPNKNTFAVLNNYKVIDFDYSWHPDDTEEPYIYVFGNNQYPAEIMPTIEYNVLGATQVKYINNVTATLGVDKTNWKIPSNVDITEFDFSWKPNPKDPPYIYEFGTQWQKSGGPKYIVEGATEVKYVDIKVTALPSKQNFAILDNLVIDNFDFSWHPDTTEEPYIYVFGNTQYPAEIMPTIEYRVPGATKVKYVNDVVAKLGVDMTNWVVPTDVDTTGFDFSWKPNPKDPDYIYEFGTQWQKTGGPRYVLGDATETKYVDSFRVKKLPNKTNFAVFNNYKISNFDFSWHPDSTEEPYIYVFGNTQYPAEIMPTLEYTVPGATQVKYVGDIVAKLGPDFTNWEIPENINVTDFDFSWKPNPKDPAFIYQFGTQHQKTGGPKYIVEDATQVKYVEGSKAKSLPNKKNWILPKDLNIVDFDYSWHPDSTEDAYIYIFPTQWQLTGGPKYVMEGATELKFMDTPCAKVGSSMKHWEVPSNIVLKDFDFSWHPHPEDPTFIYHFATQWHDRGGPVYTAPGANKDTPVKYIDGRIIKATLGPNTQNWIVPNDVNTDDFDFSWVPHPNDPPYIYQFGTQWQKTGGPRYVVPNASETKYIDGPKLKAKKLPSKKYWVNPYQSDVTKFDYTWHPDDTSPPYIYQFGTLLDNNDGPRYITPNASGDVIYLRRIDVEKIEEIESVVEETVEDIVVEKYYIKTTLEDLINEHPNELFWALNPDINYEKFDFNWRPNIEQAKYVHAFGYKENLNTQTYFVSAPMWHKGNKDVNYITTNYNFDFVIDMFFVDRSNVESSKRFEKLKSIYGDRIQKTRYLNSWVDTINRCINRATSNLCWILNSELDYSNFNFDYYPNPWQMKMVHVFGTQWSHWGTTFMVNRETFAEDTKYIKIIEHLSNLNFVKDTDKLAKATNCLYDVFVIDHGNKEMFKTFRTIQSKVGEKSVTAIKYDESYLKTFKELLKQVPEKKEHYVWICSSVCDYSQFDFTYICDPFAREHLHVFPSDRQKFGDTFLVNINQLRTLVSNMTILEEYGKVNYNQHQRVKRLSPPVIVSEYDTHVAGIMEDYEFPYAIFVTEDNKDIKVVDEEPMNLWAEDTKNIIVTSTGGTRIIAPKEAKDFVETQLYDYPYIKKMSKLAKSKPLDIVYLSNGEVSADENYEHLLSLTKDLENRVVRVDGVNGRVAAYHAAATASETPWMFTVFAKLKVNPKFDFNWQPDRLQMPKHYMFNAKNPVNGLVYGHQGIIAYNKKLTLANNGIGLDFTLDDPHETITMLSGTAHYNTDAFSTWRTAFREAIKLHNDSSTVSKERLEKWLTVAEGDFAEYSISGASDAIQYYEEVNGDYNKLKLSYEWKWLLEYFNNKYNK